MFELTILGLKKQNLVTSRAPGGWESLGSSTCRPVDLQVGVASPESRNSMTAREASRPRWKRWATAKKRGGLRRFG